jgi:hypothetical protein
VDSGAPGRTDAWLEGWREVGIAVQETHTDFAESAQGAATDGTRWFVVSNRAVAGLMRKITAPAALFGRYRNTRRVGVFAADGRKLREVAPDAAVWTELVRRNRAVGKARPIHLGAPAWARDTLLVPTQKPSGVWALSDDLTRQDWWADPTPEWPERHSWVDVHPESGLLYTSLHWRPDRLQALEWGSLARVPAADIVLQPSDPALDRVQGGAFVQDRVVLTSSAGGGRVYSYGQDGQWLGVRQFGDYFEMEGIAVHAVMVGGRAALVHILDAGTHYWPFVKWGDNFAVRSYCVPPQGES